MSSKTEDWQAKRLATGERLHGPRERRTWLTLGECTAILGVKTRQTLRSYAEKGAFEILHGTNIHYVMKDDFEAFLKKWSPEMKNNFHRKPRTPSVRREAR